MNSRNYTNLAKRAIGLAGVVVAGAVAAFPASAELTPNSGTSNPSSEASTSAPLNSPTTAPAPGAGAVPQVELPQTPNAVDSSTEASTETSTETSQTPASTETSPAPGAATLSTPADPASTETSAESAKPAIESGEATAPAAPESTSEAPASKPGDENVAAASGTIVDVAKASGEFNTLLAALTEAELAEVLQGEGPYTVFAPTDDAFAALPAGTVEELLKPENREQLVKVLTYHVVPGEVTSSQLASGDVETVEGSSVAVMVHQGAVMVNDANVIQADIPATNGVIHAIDRVILPPNL